MCAMTRDLATQLDDDLLSPCPCGNGLSSMECLCVDTPGTWWYCIACRYWCTIPHPCEHCTSEHTHKEPGARTVKRDWLDLGNRLERHETGLPILVVDGPCDGQRIEAPALRHCLVTLMIAEPGG